MKRFLVGALVAGVAVAIGLFVFAQSKTLPDRDPVMTFDDATVARGEYLARAGDCIACHTAPGGKPFAGGLAFATPVGTIWSTNITPDREHGIGRYSLEAFERALKRGVAQDGHPLYPAMPFPSYARVRHDDIAAMYAYFMRGVAPVPAPNKASAIPWPASIRWPLAYWGLAFAPSPGEPVARSTDPVVARGAYLVEGLGHCGACHTPRGLAFQEKALTDDGTHFVAGANVENWIAKSLRGEPAVGLGAWSERDIVTILRTGRTDRTAVFGGMRDVVEHSMQYLRDDDLVAIARYLKTLAPADRTDVAMVADATTALALHGGDERARGASTYLDNCAACHRTDGQGYAAVFPALAGNSAVLTKDPSSVVQIVLAGGSMPSTAHAPAAFAMPPFGWRLDDAQVADVATFVRTSWGNRAPTVTTADVARVRKTLPPSIASIRGVPP